jgi:soluble lytic murein transglycosylase-like protein
MPPAHADLWSCTDAQGVTRLASEALEGRCELFYRGPVPAAGAQPEAAAEPGAAVTPAGSASPRLTWFDVTPGYKSIRHLLREVSQAQGIDYDLLKAVIATESGFDSAAVSHRGAVGLMQIMPATAGRFGVVADKAATVEQKLTNPGVNIRAGARYLSHLMTLFPGQLELALAAYNAGEGTVQRAGNRVPPIRETQNYVKTVLQLYALLKPPPPVLPPPVRAQASSPLTPTPARGGALGRSNMISTFPQPPVLLAAPAKPSEQ